MLDEGRRIEAETGEGPAAAEAAGLRFVSDDMDGITRRARGKSFRYELPSGAVLRDRIALARIRKLAIPPAWTDVWICPTANGHIQATGRDARGRKQYRYHADWNEVRDAAKYDRLLAFARLLPRIRKTVAAHMAERRLTRNYLDGTLGKALGETLKRQRRRTPGKRLAGLQPQEAATLALLQARLDADIAVPAGNPSAPRASANAR